MTNIATDKKIIPHKPSHDFCSIQTPRLEHSPEDHEREIAAEQYQWKLLRMILEEVCTLIVKYRCHKEKSLKNAKALTAIKLQRKIFVHHFVWKVSNIQGLITSIKRLWKWSMPSVSKAACLLLSLSLILDNKTCLTAKWFKLLED